MSLTRRPNLPVAPARILHLPAPVLLVERFDRAVRTREHGDPVVRELRADG